MYSAILSFSCRIFTISWWFSVRSLRYRYCFVFDSANAVFQSGSTRYRPRPWVSFSSGIGEEFVFPMPEFCFELHRYRRQLFWSAGELPGFSAIGNIAITQEHHGCHVLYRNTHRFIHTASNASAGRCRDHRYRHSPFPAVVGLHQVTLFFRKKQPGWRPPAGCWWWLKLSRASRPGPSLHLSGAIPGPLEVVTQCTAMLHRWGCNSGYFIFCLEGLLPQSFMSCQFVICPMPVWWDMNRGTKAARFLWWQQSKSENHRLVYPLQNGRYPVPFCFSTEWVGGERFRWCRHEYTRPAILLHVAVEYLGFLDANFLSGKSIVLFMSRCTSSTNQEQTYSWPCPSLSSHGDVLQCLTGHLRPHPF